MNVQELRIKYETISDCLQIVSKAQCISNTGLPLCSHSKKAMVDSLTHYLELTQSQLELAETVAK